MHISLENELNLMSKYNITAEELFVILLIFHAQEGHKEFISQYYQGTTERSLRDVLVSLQSKGLINQSYKIPETGKPFNPDDVTFNKIIVGQFIQHSSDMGMELFFAYPATTFINGREFSLRNIAKNYKSMDDFAWHYGKAIKFSPKAHQEVLDLLEWGKDNNLINSGICDFVISMKWLELKQLQDENDYTINDTSRLV